MNKFHLVFTKITGFIPARIFFKWKVYYEPGAEKGKKLPKGSILMSNHRSIWDFILYLMVFFRTTVRFQVAEVIYEKNAFIAWVLKSFGSIRVNRFDFDFSFIEESEKILKDGERVGIFPEGQLPRGGKMSRFTPSCALIALRSGADIIPVYTDGNYGLFKRTHLIIGRKISLRQFCGTEDLSKEILRSCNDHLLGRILELEAELKRQMERKKR